MNKKKMRDGSLQMLAVVLNLTQLMTCAVTYVILQLQRGELHSVILRMNKSEVCHTAAYFLLPSSCIMKRREMFVSI